MQINLKYERNTIVQVTPVTFEHHQDALGIGQSTPRISWKSIGDEKDWRQISYELRITLCAGSEKPQTCKVKASDSVLVPWPYTPLKSREAATVQVRVTGPEGSEPTDWSAPSTVEIGLLQKQDWKSHMIAAPRTISTRNSLRPALFRKDFQLSNKVRSARLYATAYGLYEAFINGKQVGDHVLAPGWTAYQYHLNYQTFDVTELLKTGDNVIGAEVGEGWFSGRLGFGGGWRDFYGDKLAVLAQLEVTYEDGTVETIVSDKSWKTSVGGTVSAQIYDGVVYDATQKTPGWSSPSFKDSLWSSATELEFPSTKLQAPEGPPVRKVETVKPKSIFESPSGKTVVDFGQNLVGWLRVQVSGPSDHKIVFTHTEVLENGEIATRPLRDCHAEDSLILAGKPMVWEPKFTFHGFRYVQIDNWPKGDPNLEDLEAIVIHTDMQRTGWFECSEPMVNQLHENICWGMKGNFVSIPTDCPQRDERLGWTGDIQIFSPTASFLYDTFGMLSGWLKDLAIEQNEANGVVPVVIPNILPRSYTQPQAAWSDAAVITPWDLYNAFGDRKIFQDQLDSMKQWLEKGIKRQSNGLWDPDTDQLGDWLDPDAPPEDAGKGKTDPHLVANAYLVHVTKLFQKICTILGCKDEASHYKSETDRLKKLFQVEYMTSTGRLAPNTMTSISLALSFDLYNSAEQVRCATKSLSKIIRSNNFRIGTGFVGTPIILPSLTATSQTQLAYRMLLEKKCPSWLYPITMGATTMWERWDSMLPDGSINPGSMTSFNHYALGSVGASLHSTVGGISAKEPGWKVVRFEPVPGGTMTWAKVRHLSPYGEVKCEWQAKAERLVVKIEVPLNCTGEVKLPGKEEVNIVGSGKHEFEVEYEAQEWPPKAIFGTFADPQKEEF
ncbi:related to alfa-L-rhamnosidase [Rhynchosporium agropyri]|uniref:alpha-L-rhamnosidase n=1 Tax=Rhynchosporium agropyri TaxID=914238 RepID=A0A1E1LR91_9HELO|nr:related to alfa-L-rhamnosidase [Rhynchosporium agropyri]